MKTELEIYDHFISKEQRAILYGFAMRYARCSLEENYGDYGDNYSYSKVNIKDIPEHEVNVDLCLKSITYDLSAQLNANLVDGHFNVNQYGYEGKIHIDDYAKNDGIGCLIYLHEKWLSQWFGYTLFYHDLDSEKLLSTEYAWHYKDVQAVLPLPRRAVIYPNSIPHRAGPIGRDAYGYRVILSLRFQKIKDAN